MRPWDSKIAGISLPSADSESLRERPHCRNVWLSPCLTITPFFMGWGLVLQASMEQWAATSMKVTGLPPSASIRISALLVGLLVAWFAFLGFFNWELHGSLFVVGPEGGLSCHTLDLSAHSVVSFVDWNTRAVVGVPRSIVQGFSTHTRPLEFVPYMHGYPAVTRGRSSSPASLG